MYGKNVIWNVHETYNMKFSNVSSITDSHTPTLLLHVLHYYIVSLIGAGAWEFHITHYMCISYCILHVHCTLPITSTLHITTLHVLFILHITFKFRITSHIYVSYYCLYYFPPACDGQDGWDWADKGSSPLPWAPCANCNIYIYT